MKKHNLKAWIALSDLQQKVGIITDYFGNYIELFCQETNQFYIVHENKVTLID